MNKYTEKEIQFLRENYTKFGSKYCSKNIDRTRDSIRMKAKSLGLSLSKEEISNIYTKAKETQFSNYKVNHNLFLDIKKPEVAYILGFMWADGHVCKPGTGSYTIKVEILDSDMKKLKKVFKTVGKWNEYYYKRTSNNAIACFATSNKILYNFLVENDYLIKSGASPDKILSKIPEHLQHYWWRGYFDGDGHANKLGKSISIASTFDQDWSFVKKLGNKIKVNFIIKQRISKRGRSSSCFLFSIKEISNFFDYIYQDYIKDKIGLGRKYKNILIAKNKAIFLEKSQLENIKVSQKINFDLRDSEKRRLFILNLIKENSGYIRRPHLSYLLNNFSYLCITDDIVFLVKEKLVSRIGKGSMTTYIYNGT